MLFKNIFAVCSVLATARAAPAPVEAIEDANASPLVNRSALSKRGWVDITMFGGDNCGGSAHSYSSSSGIICIPVPSSKRSISVNTGSGGLFLNCRAQTWSGTNCQGSSAIMRNGCVNVLYGSVLLDCTLPIFP